MICVSIGPCKYILNSYTSSGGILKQLGVDGCSWKVDVSHDTSSDEDILDAGLLMVSISLSLSILRLPDHSVVKM